MQHEVSALILAGGKATRLGGIDKRELVIDGKKIFERQCEVLAPRVAEILVSSARQVPGYRSITDGVAGAGPLAGIAAGLAAVTTPWLLVVAGDMPFVSGAVVDLVLAAIDEAFDAVGVRVGGLPEPLFAVYQTRSRAAAERRLAARRYKASGLLTDEGLRVRWLDEPALREVDPTLRAFFNVNEPSDLARE
jgi:molybdopterin-guanine dinucleotide biosynthesis protein A